MPENQNHRLQLEHCNGIHVLMNIKKGYNKTRVSAISGGLRFVVNQEFIILLLTLPNFLYLGSFFIRTKTNRNRIIQGNKLIK